MKYMLLALFCGIFFQLCCMEEKHITSILPTIISDSSVASNFDNTKQKSYYLESYNKLIKDIEHSQKDWRIINLLCELKLYKYGEKPFSYANIIFKKQDRERSMLVEFDSYVLCADMCTIEPGQLYMIFTFKGACLPFYVKNEQLIAEQNAEIPDSIKKLMILLDTYTKEKSYTQNEIVSLPENKFQVIASYNFEEEKTIPAKDAVSLCFLLQPFNAAASVMDSKL